MAPDRVGHHDNVFAAEPTEVAFGSRCCESLVCGLFGDRELTHDPLQAELAQQKWMIADLERRLASTRKVLLRDQLQLRQTRAEASELRRQLVAVQPGFEATELRAILLRRQSATSQTADELPQSELQRARAEIDDLSLFKRSRMYRLAQSYYRLFGLPVLGPVLVRARRVVGLVLRLAGIER